MKKMNKKGFTLAELLIVVAIIGVLTAIAIPVFNSQLEKAREATDAANIRDYYAEITTALVTDDLDFSDSSDSMTVAGGATASVQSTLGAATGNFTIRVTGFRVNQRVGEWQSGVQDIGGYPMPANTNMVGAAVINYVYTVTPESTYLSEINFSAT